MYFSHVLMQSPMRLRVTVHPLTLFEQAGTMRLTLHFNGPESVCAVKALGPMAGWCCISPQELAAR